MSVTVKCLNPFSVTVRTYCLLVLDVVVGNFDGSAVCVMSNLSSEIAAFVQTWFEFCIVIALRCCEAVLVV